MVAEKNSIAEAIGRALSSSVKAKKGKNVVLYFSGYF